MVLKMLLEKILKILKRFYTNGNFCYIFIPSNISLHDNYSNYKNSYSLASLYRHINSSFIVFEHNEVDILYRILYGYFNELKRCVNRAFYNVKLKFLSGISITLVLIYKEGKFMVVTTEGVSEYTTLEELIYEAIKYIVKNINLESMTSCIREVKLYIPVNSDIIRIKYSCNFTNSILGIILLNSLVLTLYIKAIVSI